MYESCSDHEVLISRVIDGEASSADWQSLRAMAERDPGVWTELEQTQDAHQSLCVGLENVCRVVEAVDLPDSHPEQLVSGRLAKVGAWGGWLAAATLLLAWTVGMPLSGDGHSATSSIGPNLGPEYVRVDTPEDALRAYVDRGRDAGSVVGLVADPRIVETRPLPDGSGMEVLYVREILERRLVDQVYRLGKDEAGNIRPVQVRIIPASDRPF